MSCCLLLVHNIFQRAKTGVLPENIAACKNFAQIEGLPHENFQNNIPYFFPSVVFREYGAGCRFTLYDYNY
jgi:hypothetical protein